MNHCPLDRVVLSLMVALITTACTPPTPPLTPNPSLAPPTPTPLYEKVDVGGYKLRILCTGQGTPTVIVDAAFAEPAVESGNWLSVRYEIEKSTRICVYDRAGLGSSDAAPTQPRTSQDMVKDLHTLLVNVNVSGPYILVGHDIGGYTVRLYASQYPDEIVGMVLVDSFHPDHWSETLAVLPPESPDEPDSLKAMRALLVSLVHDTSNPERMDISASAALVRATNRLGDLPLVVLTRSPAWVGDPNLPPEVVAKIEQIWQDLQSDLVGLSSNSTHVIATKAGHYIQVDEPQLVIEAILNMVDEARKRGQ